MGYPRVETECLLALAEHARGGAAVEGVNVQEGWDATTFNSQTHRFRECEPSLYTSYSDATTFNSQYTQTHKFREREPSLYTSYSDATTFNSQTHKFRECEPSLYISYSLVL